MLISDYYRVQNRELHRRRPDYGAGQATAHWVPTIARLANAVGAESILDYGCGKGRLKRALVTHGLDRRVREYDPAIPGNDGTPAPADLVVCTDVLEHVEPECLETVIGDLRRVTRKAGFVTVATRPAKKLLPDGRNAHLIIEPMEWWLQRLWRGFALETLSNGGGEFMVVLTPR